MLALSQRSALDPACSQSNPFSPSHCLFLIPSLGSLWSGCLVFILHFFVSFCFADDAPGGCPLARAPFCSQCSCGDGGGQPHASLLSGHFSLTSNNLELPPQKALRVGILQVTEVRHTRVSYLTLITSHSSPHTHHPTLITSPHTRGSRSGLRHVGSFLSDVSSDSIILNLTELS